jgi:hypothetical protein
MEREKEHRPDQALEALPSIEEDLDAEGVETTDRESMMWGGGGDKKKKKHKGDGEKTKEETERLEGTVWAKGDKGEDLPPSLEDLVQGGLNDCYVFAAMAAIVHSDPARITSMIKDNGGGTYTVTFEGEGDAQTVTVDFVKGKHGLVGDRKALWPLIIEKAYAAQRGGLDKLDNGGFSNKVVEDMKDLEANDFDPQEKEAAWILAKLEQAQKDKKPTTVLAPTEKEATKAQVEATETDPNLHFWHYYAVIGVDATGKRVKLFNPWGSDHPGTAKDGWIDIDVLKTFFKSVEING